MTGKLLTKYVDLEHMRKVWAVGDIHGEWERFVEELKRLGVDKERDAVISVGDLVDRGPRSEETALWFDTYENFYRVLGNHDVMPADYLDSSSVYGRYYATNGGQWFINLLSRDEGQAHFVSKQLLEAPYVLTVKTPKGRRVGFSHADCYSDWDEFESRINNGSQDAVQTALWNRESAHIANHGLEKYYDRLLVRGIDHVFHGHTPLGAVVTAANRTFIDTGACFGGSMTVIEVDEHLDGVVDAL